MEMKNLNVYGYGVKSFTLSMLETAIELTDGRIPARDLEVILNWGKRMLQQPTELLEGVADTLHALSGQYDLMLITKGDLFDQEGKLARSGLADLFWKVEIVSEKDEATYRRILAAHDITPGELLMVGNSVRSDILPVLAIGGRGGDNSHHSDPGDRAD